MRQLLGGVHARVEALDKEGESEAEQRAEREAECGIPDCSRRDLGRCAGPASVLRDGPGDNRCWAPFSGFAGERGEAMILLSGCFHWPPACAATTSHRAGLRGL